MTEGERMRKKGRRGGGRKEGEGRRKKGEDLAVAVTG